MQGFVTFIRCDKSELAVLRERLGQWLEAQPLQDVLAHDVKLVAHEAARSAIEHADPPDSVKVSVEIDDEVVVRVVDLSARPWEIEPPEDRDEIDSLTLIQTLAQRVESVPDPEGTALVATLARS